MNNTKPFIKFWLPVIVYAMLIFTASSFETPLNLKLEATGLDKLAHFLEYSILGFLLVRAIRASSVKISARSAIFIAFVVGSFYGLTDEIHQSFVPGRFVSIFDFMCDSIGSLAGAVIFTYYTPWGRKIRNSD